MLPVLNIQVYVDVVALLVGKPVERSVFLYDDGPFPGSGMGTPALSSPVGPGQWVRWTMTPIDVQTPVWIDSLTFGCGTVPAPSVTDLPRSDELPGPTPLWARSWEGMIPPVGLTPDTTYPYRMVIGFGEDDGKLVALDGASLAYLPVYHGPQAAEAPVSAAADHPAYSAACHADGIL
ncbi:hypothetical protein [Insolitispirillum peregrinum]|uniref:Uncharacterized protein n=1 Tax=Insolitispirillum peregrinum TaxID=80876 RepID=A0A1N7MYK1_9PROT|nr:hypothetical protein [Insolitispirillum peregrinum]SIS91234.1 hypothetical protein SAMN05421779_104442 [Insolitispirillum peregrinum]